MKKVIYNSNIYSVEYTNFDGMFLKLCGLGWVKKSETTSFLKLIVNNILKK